MINIVKRLMYKNKVLDVPETPIDENDWQLDAQLLETKNGINLKQFSRREKTPEVKNQGGIGSCVGHSGRVVYGDTPEFEEKEPSAMWIYKHGKIYDPFPGENYSGTTIKGACRGLIKKGCCEERFWPYKDSEHTEMLKGASENAAQHKIDSYYVIDKTKHDLIKQGLLNESLWTSIRVHEHFYYTPSSGMVDSEKYLASENVGGHAIAMTGWKYVDGELYWEFQNSWGKYFGNKGFFYLESSLYEQILINAAGPIFIKTTSEARKESEEYDKKQAEDKRKQEEDNQKQRNKSKKIAAFVIGGIVALLAWLYNLS